MCLFTHMWECECVSWYFRSQLHALVLWTHCSQYWLLGLDPSCFVCRIIFFRLIWWFLYVLLCFCGLQGTSTNRPFTSWHMKTPACVWRQVSADSTNFRTTQCSGKLKQCWSRRTPYLTRWPSWPKRWTRKSAVLKVPSNNSELQNLLNSVDNKRVTAMVPRAVASGPSAGWLLYNP